MSEEESMQLAMILAQNLQTDGELGGEGPNTTMSAPSSVNMLSSDTNSGLLMVNTPSSLSSASKTVTSGIATASGHIDFVDLQSQFLSQQQQQQQHNPSSSGGMAMQLSQSWPQVGQQPNLHQQQQQLLQQQLLQQQQFQQQQQHSLIPLLQAPQVNKPISLCDSVQSNQQNLRPSQSRQSIQPQNNNKQPQQQNDSRLPISVCTPPSSTSSSFEQHFTSISNLNNQVTSALHPQPHSDTVSILAMAPPTQIGSTSLLPQTNIISTMQSSSSSSSSSSSLPTNPVSGVGVNLQHAADLNLYEQLENLAHSHLSTKKNVVVVDTANVASNAHQTLSKLNQISTNVTRTVISCLPSDTSPLQQNATSSHFGNISSLPPPPPPLSLPPTPNHPPPAYPTGRIVANQSASALPNQQANLKSLSKSAPTTSISMFSKQTTTLAPQISFALSAPTSSSVSSLSIPSISLSTTLPPFAKRAKMINASSVIQSHQQEQADQQQQQILQIKQQLQLSSQLLQKQQKQPTPAPLQQALTTLTLGGRRNVKNVTTNNKMAASKESLVRHTQMPTSRNNAKSSASPLVLPEGNKLSLPRTQSPAGKASNAGSASEMSPQSSLSSSPAKLRLPSQNVVISEISGSSRLTLPESIHNISSSYSSFSSPTPASSSSSSSSYEATTTKTSNSVQYTLTPSTSLNSSSPIQTTILSDPSDKDMSSESLFVLVRQPSPTESVPSTVRHTLPDTFPAQVTLPSSQLDLLPQVSTITPPNPPSSQSASQQQQQPQQNSSPSNIKTLSQTIDGSKPGLSQRHSSAMSERHSVLSSQLASPRANWFSPSSNTASLGSQQAHLNGVLSHFPSRNSNSPSSAASMGSPLVKAEHLRAKLNSSPTAITSGLMRSKTLNVTASESRLSTLTPPLGVVPVVCSSTSLPGFGQSLPTTAFKTTGTS